MSRVESGIEELRLSFSAPAYPAEFLTKYDQLECLSHGHGTETFLIGSRTGNELFVAKCYDKQVFAAVSESSVLPRLHHEGLPVYLESFETDRMYVTVRGYVEGTPLDRYAAENVLSERQAVDFCLRLCDILSYLHTLERPVIHRDVKPQNIIVGPNGAITLIDFDIARQYCEGAENDTQCMGTRVYAPPEQYGFSQTDCRADIYSLGVLLRFLLTGSEKERPDKPLPRPLGRIVARCTAFSPKERFASVEAVKRKLLKSDERHRQKTALMRSVLATALAFLCGGFAIGRYTTILTPTGASDAVVFREPLIEAAARAQLGKTEDEPLTAEELETVRELYIFGTEVSATREAFESAPAGDGYTRGGIVTLADLAQKPNIEELQISYQELEDISGITALKNLVSVNLMHTRVSDISALAGEQSLLSLNLYGTNVSDVSCLDTCLRLEYLELGHTLVSSADTLGGFATVTELSLTGLKWNTLDGIERYASLETLNLTGARMDSLDALKAMSALKTVLADDEQYETLTKMFANTDVSVKIQ